MMAVPDTARDRRAMSGAALRIRDLTVGLRRSGMPVIRDVSLEVAPAKILGLVGESGCGKSTLGLALLGHAREGLRITGGSCHIGETDVLSLGGSELRRARGRLVAYVPQDPASALNPTLRLGAQLREAIEVHEGVLEAGESVDDRAAELLDEVRLPDTRAFLRSFPHQISGGQQQRIGLAMAFACRPRLIVLDEPTTGLDVTTQRHVLDTVRRLADAYQVTAVYITHDLPVVAEIADSTAVMYAGRIVERAPSAALFTTPRHQYTARLLKAIPTPERSTTLVGINGHPPRPGRWPPGCAFADRCAAASDRCRNSEPELEALGGDRLLRCYHPVEHQTGSEGLRTTSPVSAGARGGLEVRGLNASYGATPVLFDVDLSVEPGRCLGVVGESGSGKTTLARCLVGLHTSWSGEAVFDGTALESAASRRGADARRRVQYIFQNPYGSLNPRMSVAENVEQPLRHFERLGWRQRRARIQETLELVALGRDFADRMPDQLSGGERQRVAVARALIVQPDLLICDEVTSALDVSVQALLVEQLRQLQHEQGLTMVFITHNLSVVRSIAQDVVVLERGYVVERADVDRILGHPEHPYTQQLLRDLPRLADAEGTVAVAHPLGG